jgi:hypothetical protein
MQMPPDDGVTAQIGIAAPTGIVLLRRVEALIGEFHKVAMLWRTVVRYEASELLCLPGGSSQATIADISAELDGEAHAECADRVSTVVEHHELRRAVHAQLESCRPQSIAWRTNRRQAHNPLKSRNPDLVVDKSAPQRW